jgi:hypothetical protein
MDSRLKNDIQRLATRRASVDPLKAAGAPAPILTQTAIGSSAAAGQTGGDGIASPLIETGRTLHATQAVSSDGLFVWSVPDTITMIDAAGRSVEFQFVEP